MTIDQIALNEISWAYAAKNIAPYLQVTVPEPPKEWKKIQRAMVIGEKISDFIEGLHSTYLFFADRKMYKEKKEYMEYQKEIGDGLLKSREDDDSQYLQELRDLGIITQQEIDAYTIASSAGRAMKSFVFHSGIHAQVDGFEVEPAEKNHNPGWIIIPPERFDYCLKASIGSGISILCGEYWIPIE